MVDLLFWAWVAVTLLAFANMFIPDPIPFIDEALLVTISIILLLALAVRGITGTVAEVWAAIGGPGVAFAAALVTLTLLDRIRSKKR